GVETELLRASLSKLQLQLNEVATKGTGPAAESLDALGIKATHAAGALRPTEQVLRDVVATLSGLDDAEQKAELVKLFGERGAELAPLLSRGSSGIRAMATELEAMGVSVAQPAAALAALGIEATVAEGKLKTTGQVLEEVADAIQGMDATE